MVDIANITDKQGIFTLDRVYNLFFLDIPKVKAAFINSDPLVG